MFKDTLVLEDCLFELPPIGGFTLGGLGKVGTIEQPVRKVEAEGAIYPNGSGLAAPIGGIYTIEYLSGKKREIFVWGDPRERDFSSAIFLQEGRRGDQLNDVRALMIDVKTEAVPHWLIDRLRKYEADRARIVAAHPDVA